MGRKLTQCDRILRHLRDHGYITSLEAVNEYGIMRLAARIGELRERGYHIRSMHTTGKNRYGENINYAVYVLLGGAK